MTGRIPKGIRVTERLPPDGGLFGYQVKGFPMGIFDGLFGAKPKEEKDRSSLLVQQANSFFDLVKSRKGFQAINTSLLLGEGENAYLQCDSELIETRSVREYVSGGAGFRLMKGVYVGGRSGKSESKQSWKSIDTGKLVLTNKRLVFDGEKENRSFPLKKLVSVVPDIGGYLTISSESRSKDSVFSVDNCFIWAGAANLIPKVKDPGNLGSTTIDLEFRFK